MVYFSLPYFYENEKFNYMLYKYIELYPDRLNFDCKIESFYGNLPFSFWDGEINTCITSNRKILLNNLIDNIVKNSVIPVWFDISNIFFTESDFYDVHLNTVLKKFEGAGHGVKVLNNEIYNFIKEKYFGYDIIISENASLFNTDISLIPEEEVTLVELPSFFNNESKEFLIDIPNKKQICMTIGNGCKQCPLEQIENCKKEEMRYQASFSGNSIYNGCEHYCSHKGLMEEFLSLKNLGFTHFKISPFPYVDFEKYNHLLTQFIIKPEYCYDFVLFQKEEEKFLNG